MENYLKEMLVTLADAGVEFVVGGGVACVLHGVERVTLDLDVAVQMNAPNLDRLIHAVERLNLRPRVPVSLADIGARISFVRWLRRRERLSSVWPISTTRSGILIFS